MFASVTQMKFELILYTRYPAFLNFIDVFELFNTKKEIQLQERRRSNFI